jgi:hypothetical protein
MDQGHEGLIREVLQEDGRSSMYRTIIVWLPVWKRLAMNFFNMLPVYYHDYLVSSNWIAILTDVYFYRLKINHDSHEFILESGTVVNSKNYLFYIGTKNIFFWNKLGRCKFFLDSFLTVCVANKNNFPLSSVNKKEIYNCHFKLYPRAVDIFEFQQIVLLSQKNTHKTSSLPAGHWHRWHPPSPDPLLPPPLSPFQQRNNLNANFPGASGVVELPVKSSRCWPEPGVGGSLEDHIMK